MRIVADLGTCEGLGMCEAMAPDYFEVGDDGYVQVHAEAPADGDEGDVRAAVDACPVMALKLDA